MQRTVVDCPNYNEWNTNEDQVNSDQGLIKINTLLFEKGPETKQVMSRIMYLPHRRKCQAHCMFEKENKTGSSSLSASCSNSEWRFLAVEPR